MNEDVDLPAAPGWISPEVRDEFPGLRLAWMTVAAARRDSPKAIAHRLAGLSNRFRGAGVVALRSQPIPRAYRSFFRQIGLDPDVTRIPIEAAAVARLAYGGFRSYDLVSDALLIALIETGVGLWALDAARVAPGGLGIRVTGAGERLGSAEIADYLQPDRLVVADDELVHALLFGDVARGHEPTARTERIVVFAIAVDGVPEIHVEEALWVCTEVLAAG
jgi:DNA/RNA-binding domain of Phe-tRNA-synthetase-like protein